MQNEYQKLKSRYGSKKAQENPFMRFGFLGNPFPKRGESTAEPFYNQKEAWQAFDNMLYSFTVESDGGRSDQLLLYGGHRVGKTNFLKHWELQLTRLVQDRLLSGYIPVYLTVNTDPNFVEDIHKPIVTELSKVFFQAFFEIFKIDQTVVPTTDLERAIVGAKTRRDPQAKFSFMPDSNIPLFTKWFSGERCAQAELKTMGGLFSSIDTSSLAIKYFRDFVRMARQQGTFKGLVVFIDEFEQLFSTAVTASKRARYLQDLRHFIDMLQEGVLIAIASLPTIEQLFQRDYPALKNRFNTIELQQIRTPDEALKYAQEYIQFGHKIYGEIAGQNDNFEELLSPEEIKATFEITAVEHKGAQGLFLAELHKNAEHKIRRNT